MAQDKQWKCSAGKTGGKCLLIKLLSQKKKNFTKSRLQTALSNINDEQFSLIIFFKDWLQFSPLVHGQRKWGPEVTSHPQREPVSTLMCMSLYFFYKYNYHKNLKHSVWQGFFFSYLTINWTNFHQYTLIYFILLSAGQYSIL